MGLNYINGAQASSLHYGSWTSSPLYFNIAGRMLALPAKSSQVVDSQADQWYIFNAFCLCIAKWLCHKDIV